MFIFNYLREAFHGGRVFVLRMIAVYRFFLCNVPCSALLLGWQLCGEVFVSWKIFSLLLGLLFFLYWALDCPLLAARSECIELSEQVKTFC